MAFANITDPGLAQGFSVLADAIAGPSPTDIMNADYARRRSLYTDAQTQNELQQTIAAQRSAYDLNALQELLADPTAMSDPANRAYATSLLAGLDHGMQYGPGFLTGASTFTDPNLFSPEDFSNVLLGTGVVSGWDNTPSGFQTKENNDLAQTLMQQQGAMDRQTSKLEFQRDNPTSGSSTPLEIQAKDVEDLKRGVRQTLASRLQVSPNTPVDPQVEDLIMRRATEIYQRTRNYQTAITQAVDDVEQEYDLYVDSSQGWSGKVKTQRDPKEAPSPAPEHTTPEPDTQPSEHPHAGSEVSAPPQLEATRDTRTGEYRIVQGGQSIKIENGQTATSASSGLRIVFYDGKWYEFAG